MHFSVTVAMSLIQDRLCITSCCYSTTDIDCVSAFRVRMQSKEQALAVAQKTLKSSAEGRLRRLAQVRERDLLH